MSEISAPKKVLSKELSTNLQISNEQLYNIGKKVKNTKKKINTTIDIMEDYVEKGTEKEREAVALALENLHKKMAKVKEEKNYQSLQKELKYLEDKLNITMENVFNQYSKAIKKLYISYPNQKERQMKLNEFHQAVGEAFLTKDEKKIMSLMKQKVKEIPHRMITLV